MVHPTACDVVPPVCVRCCRRSDGWEDRGAFPPKLLVVLSHPYPADGGGLALAEGMSDLKGRDRAVCSLLYLARESAAAAATSRSGCPAKDGGGRLGDGKSSSTSTLVLRLDGKESDASIDGSPNGSPDGSYAGSDGVRRGYVIWMGLFGYVPCVQLRRG